MEKILVINFGSTSTKLAYYENTNQLYLETIEHPAEELKQFNHFSEQTDYRKNCIENFIATHQIQREALTAVVSRGGNTEPLESGVYHINPEMIEQQLSPHFGQHPTDLGSSVAYLYHQELNIPALVVDPPCTDEFEDIARVTGHPLFKRRSCFHALNQKATAKRYAAEIGKAYDELNLIVVHLGGGITINPHRQGRIIDGDDGLEGGGPFSTNRTGSLPSGELIDLCFSGEYTQGEIRRMVNGRGGLTAYLNSANVKEIEEKGRTDQKYEFYLEAMIYQVAKEIGAMATVLKGQVDAIVLTGGIAYSEKVVQALKDKCGYIAEIVVYPGENEMDSLAKGAYAGLTGTEPIKNFESSDVYFSLK